MNYVFRCSSLSQIMGDARKKGEALSDTAKTFITKRAKEIVFGATFEIANKYVEKGKLVEPMAISLLNLVRGTSYVKNDERRTNEWITGEADIVAETHGVDVKSPWSLETMPLTPDEGDKPEYEWQARGYMMLYDRPRWEIAYCFVDTPPNLCKWEPAQMHAAWHILPHRRVTVVEYTRDRELEEKIIEKVQAAQAYLADLLTARELRDGLSVELNPQLEDPKLYPPDWTFLSNDAARAAFANGDLV